MHPQSTTKTFYVYVLARPDGTPFYVGKGTNQRIYAHEWEAKRGCQCRKCNTIRKIWRLGGEVQRFIVLETNDEQEALSYEIELIATYGRNTLTNLTDGGEGASGHTHTPEVRAKLKTIQSDPIARAYRSEKMKAFYADPAIRKRVSERNKAIFATPEMKERLRAQANRQYSDLEVRARISAKVKAWHADPEVSAKLSTIQKTVKGTPEARAKQSVISTARATPEYKALQSEALKAYHATPEAKAKHQAQVSDPANRAKMSEAARAGWEKRRKRNEEGNN